MGVKDLRKYKLISAFFIVFVMLLVARLPVLAANVELECASIGSDSGECKTVSGSADDLFDDVTWHPGLNESRTFSLSNTTSDQNCSVTLASTKVFEIPDNLNPLFSQKLFTAIIANSSVYFGSFNNAGAGPEPTNDQSIHDMTNNVINLGTLSPNTSKTYSWYTKFDTNAGNEYQNAEVDLDLTFNFSCTDVSSEPSNEAPVCDIDTNLEDKGYEVPVEIKFDGSDSFDPDGDDDDLEFDWEVQKDDEIIDEEDRDNDIHYEFTEAGDYKVRLKVTDDDGASDTCSKEFELEDKEDSSSDSSQSSSSSSSSTTTTTPSESSLGGILGTDTESDSFGIEQTPTPTPSVTPTPTTTDESEVAGGAGAVSGDDTCQDPWNWWLGLVLQAVAVVLMIVVMYKRVYKTRVVWYLGMLILSVLAFLYYYYNFCITYDHWLSLVISIVGFAGLQYRINRLKEDIESSPISSVSETRPQPEIDRRSFRS